MKEMAELLKQGARMLGQSCPECGTPLFQLKSGETVCPMCKRPVKFIEEGTDEESVAQQGSLEATLKAKLNEVQGKLESEDDTEKMGKLTDTLIKLLDALERVKKLGS
jgi:UPF0148 protein